MDIGDIEVSIGIDVGKSERWATALSRNRQRVLGKALPNDEDRLREVYQRLQAKGQVLAVVDQSAVIRTLVVAVAQDMGITVSHLPGLSMCRITDLAPGSAKTNAKDAAIITQAARTIPHTLRAISASDENTATLSMLTGFDLDLARQVNQTANRIRGLYTQIHPALRRVLRPWLEHDVALKVITAWPTSADLKRAGKAKTDARLKRYGYRRHAARAGQIVSALEHQTVVIVGIDAATVVLPHLTRQLIALHAQRADVVARVEILMQAHPLYQVLTSMPGIGVRTATIFLAETLGKTFNIGAQLASYAGLAPATRRSGSSIRGEHVSHGDNKGFKHTMFLSALVSLRSGPVSKAYYQRKRDQGKHHNQVVLALAHHRILTPHAMIHNGALYDPQSATKLPATARHATQGRPSAHPVPTPQGTEAKRT